MSEKCPKCGSRHDHLAQARANHGGTFYVCGTFETSGGETSLEGETCLRRQLAAANERADELAAKVDRLTKRGFEDLTHENRELAARLRAVRETIDFDLFEAASGRYHHIGIERAKRARTALSGPVPECRACAEKEAELSDLRDAANWVLHVANGISKGGGEPSESEYVASMDALRAAYYPNSVLARHAADEGGGHEQNA